MSDKDFMLAGDGWVQVTPCGEFPHAGAGVVQVIDCAACDAMAAEFNARKADANFPGVLVDFDHFSLDTGQSSEAAKRSSRVLKLRERERFRAETQRKQAAREAVRRDLERARRAK